MADITIDMVSDVVCPWCWLGLKRLEKAIAAVDGIDIAVRFRPFQLDPQVPREGVDYKTYMRAKFGPEDDAQNRFRQMRAVLEKEGPPIGADFRFDQIARRPNTLDAHRVIRWAEGQDKAWAAKEALLKAFFHDGRDLGDRDVLADAAGEAGLDRTLVFDLLKTDRDLEAVKREEAHARGLGVQGVPTFVFDGRFGAVGAQETRTLTHMIMKAAGTTTAVEA